MMFSLSELNLKFRRANKTGGVGADREGTTCKHSLARLVATCIEVITYNGEAEPCQVWVGEQTWVAPSQTTLHEIALIQQSYITPLHALRNGCH